MRTKEVKNEAIAMPYSLDTCERMSVFEIWGDKTTGAKHFYSVVALYSKNDKTEIELLEKLISSKIG